MSAVEIVLAVARSQLWVREVGGDNRGQVVEHYLGVVGLAPGNPWCAAFVAWVGSASVPRWPLPRTGGCQALKEAAERARLLRDRPAPGSVFLIWRPALHRFAHTGFVVGAVAEGWKTLEGNTNPDGGREGYGVFERVRKFAPEDRFIHWIDGPTV